MAIQPVKNGKRHQCSVQKKPSSVTREEFDELTSTVYSVARIAVDNRHMINGVQNALVALDEEDARLKQKMFEIDQGMENNRRIIKEAIKSIGDRMSESEQLVGELVERLGIKDVSLDEQQP
ncbi:MAG: hypothetical protein F4X16_12460 [Caldilineaceae bacterium SB0661_bin_34]|nr:hypothetical protein [Caldilineaceae bacterium SB0661_bin_34]